MNQVRPRVPSEILKRGYTDDEIANIYELGRLFLENGDLRRGETIMLGLLEIMGEYSPAWLAMSYIHFANKATESAVNAAQNALKHDPESVEAMLALVAGLLTLGDFNSAGTYLGEVGEKLDAGLSDDPRVVRFYKAMLARYQNR
ncbi:MAG: hypothetical protein K1X83_05445 [Oligoflexia bacterium]|nr:hypothetical protein [Oligoflexia bacterium]